MSCTQCHIMYGAPVPNFTFTGKKFRVQGYRLPLTSETYETGEVGAVDGHRLQLAVTPYLSFRYQSQFAAQSRAPGQAEAGPVTSNPTSRLAIFTGGPVGDYVGLWTEMYLTPDGSPSQEWTLGVFSFDEYDLRFVKNVGPETVFGLAFNNQGLSEISGFGPWPISVPDQLNEGGFRGWSHPNRGNLIAYGWIDDRLLLSVGASPGQDNLEWKRNNYLGQVAFAPFSASHARELWLNFMWKAGNDDIPLVSTTSPTTNRTWRYTSVAEGVDQTRPAGAYASSDMGDTHRFTGEVRYSFVDRGAHSAETVFRVNFNKDTYEDNAEAVKNSFGAAVRYVLNRTWGLDLGVSKAFTYEFTDQVGTKHEINDDWSFQGYLAFHPMMNMNINFGFATSQDLVLRQPDPLNGWRWSINVDYLM